MHQLHGIDWASERSAVISDDGVYRYELRRTWHAGKPPCCFIMLNPSTADANIDDPTIRRCIGFARSWECGQLIVVNLFAFRATKPAELYTARDPVGPENADYVRRAVDFADHHGGKIICAWGSHGEYMDQDLTVLGWIIEECSKPPLALSVTKSKQPGHPLYLKADSVPVPYTGR